MNKKPPMDKLDHLYSLYEDVDYRGECNCEQALLLQECIRQLLDWMDSKECDNLPPIDLFDICVKASHWREK